MSHRTKCRIFAKNILQIIEQQPNRVKKFVKDFGIYGIGVIGTRLISFLLLPLYTYYVNKPAEYGYFDLCLSLCMMLVPIVTLQMREGAFRFLLSHHEKDDEKQRTQVTSFVFRSLASSILLTVLVAAVIAWFWDFKFWWLSTAMLISISVHEVIAQLCRGLGRNDVYVQASIATALTIAIVSVVMLVGFEAGVQSIFIANILGHAAGVIYCECRVHAIAKYFSFTTGTSAIGKKILRYCLPMIPLTLCWWVTVNSDRLLIKHFLGLDSNGIYAVAIRFSAIIHTIALIFYQAWQESAITQFDANDRSQYYSRVYNTFIFILGTVFILYVFFLKVNFGWLVADEYSSCLPYIYPLGVAAVLSALSSSFFDPIYQSANETHRAVPAVVLTAMISVGANCLLLPLLGLYGATVASIAAYSFLLVYRLIDTRRYIKLQIAPASLLPVALMAASAIPFFFSNSVVVDCSFAILAVAVLIFVCWRFLLTNHKETA